MKDLKKQTWDYVARKPRHMAGEQGDLEIGIYQDDIPLDVGELLDCSRQGMRFRLSDALPTGQSITVRFRSIAEQIDWSSIARVRWCQPTAVGWEAGCEFEEDLSWEALGQLLLGGFLSTD